MTVLGDLLLVEDVADLMGVSTDCVSRWCRQLEFPHFKYPGKRRIYFPRADVQAYLGGATEMDVQKLPGEGRIVTPRQTKGTRR